MRSTTFLLECLSRAGIHDVVTVEPATGGLAALAGIATRRGAPPVFVKAFADAPADDVFVAEAEGLVALRELGGVATPEAALGPADRTALERLCHRLPDLLPDRPACLTHGDLWTQNILATPDGQPALIDPAVSYTWAEVDLAHVWSTSPPPEARRFFEVYAELTALDGDWRARMPIVQLRQHLAVLAQFDDDWGAGDQVRATLAPFRTRA
ncbi:fructosamine kinase family protein [Phytohabitans suffuscus]|uniref:Aminoglycoside phosphotransferase domain-containing protein n=1 Tax=Phytohabitans suffuscus TaxID=624315 RepID=A0A6F8YAD4_9ACTN|nr:fructosamine kinase family protein [Phytohabitans suffuscus]BCB83027.1 hypothetical protein Psuf_003400 [Phytohabitans suffuscus]